MHGTPSKILQGVDRLSRNFLWGSTENKKKVHLVGWNKITRSKEEGGLGLQAAKQKNTVLLAKLNWRFQSEKPALWVRVLSLKYCCQRRTLSSRIRQKPCSPIWSGFKKGTPIFIKGMKWIAGNNSGLSFWFDKWLDKGTLRSQISGPLNKGEENITLKDVVSFFAGTFIPCPSLSRPLPSLI